MWSILLLVFSEIYRVFSIVTPVLNYYPQYRIMKKENSVGTFAIEACHMRVLSNLTRIVFW